MKIVHVVDYLMPKFGYQEFLLPKWHAKHGHEVQIVTSDRYTPVPNYEESWGKMLGPRKCGPGEDTIQNINIFRLPCTWEIKTRPWIKGLEKKITKLKPEVIYCHLSASFTAFRIGRLAKKLRVPVFFDCHLSYISLKMGLSRKLLYGVLRLFTPLLVNGSINRFFGVTSESCEILEKLQGIPKKLIENLPLAVDTEIFYHDQQASHQIKKKLGIPDDSIIFMQTGKLIEEKGPHVLAEAMAELMPSDPRLWLIYLGGGSKKYLEKVFLPLKKGRVLERTILLPFVSVDQLKDYYSLADICVYPAQESLSSLEAAACGCAVIMTDLPACLERERAGVGICYQDQNINSLSEKIKLLLHDVELRKRIGKNAKENVANKYSYEAIATRVEDAFVKVLAEIPDRMSHN